MSPTIFNLTMWN